jgi:hypothetical protein
VTGDLEKLAVRDMYNGDDQIYASNGKGMHIKKIGHSIIRTPCRDLSLSDILHVPQATKSFASAITLYMTIMFSLNFTLISFSSWIGSRGKFSCKASLGEACTLFHATPLLLFIVVKFLVP